MSIFIWQEKTVLSEAVTSTIKTWALQRCTYALAVLFQSICHILDIVVANLKIENWHKNLCFNYNVSCYALSITPRKIKQHQKIVPIKFIDLLLWECPTCVAFHHSESANYQTQDWKPNPEILILDSDYIHAIPIFSLEWAKGDTFCKILT